MFSTSLICGVSCTFIILLFYPREQVISQSPLHKSRYYYTLEILKNVGDGDIGATVAWAFRNDGQALIGAMQAVTGRLFFNTALSFAEPDAEDFYAEVKVII